MCLARSSPRVCMYKLIMRGRFLPKPGNEATLSRGKQTNGKRIERLPFVSLDCLSFFSVPHSVQTPTVLSPGSSPPWWLLRRAHLLLPAYPTLAHVTVDPFTAMRYFPRVSARRSCAALALSLQRSSQRPVDVSSPPLAFRPHPSLIPSLSLLSPRLAFRPAPHNFIFRSALSSSVYASSTPLT